jgi:phage recombination protein Bet
LDIIKNEKRGGNMTEATKTVDKILEGKTQSLLTLIPKGQSPKLYLDLVKSQIMGVDSKNQQRPDEDLLLFLYVAKRTGLDPLTKQIYSVYRWNSRQGKETMTIQASIDGMRLVAQRTKGYAGQDDVIFDPIDENLKQPRKASVTVYKQMGGQRVSFTASARWAEYAGTDKNGMPTQFWAKMPYLMLGKCAEALALRKAFPNELSGVYAAEEIAQEPTPMGDLSVPTRFVKKEIEVISGAPDNGSTVSDTQPKSYGGDFPIPSGDHGGANGQGGNTTPQHQGTSVAIEMPPVMDSEQGPKVILGTTSKPDLGAMRRALKPEVMDKIENGK